MRVLIGVDGSECSLAAVRFISPLLRRDHDKVLLYYSPPSLALPDRLRLDADTVGRLQATLAESVFQRSRQEFPAEVRDIVESLAGTQKAGHGLLVAADEHRSDLIVVGSRGVGLVERLTLGSVSRSVAHGATVPVLIVREQSEQTTPSDFRVLLTCDRADSCANVKDFVGRFAWPDGTTGEVLTVFESLVGEIPAWLAEELQASEAAAPHAEHSNLLAEDKQRASDELERWRHDLPPEFRHFKPRVAEGSPARQILNTLKTDRFDLVIVGARRLGPFGRAIQGSTSEHVMTHAPCSVLIIHEHERA